MSKCKNCGKTGLFVKVSNNGLCDNCETFVTANIQNHARIYNDSIRIIETSENPDAVYSRIKLVIETLYALLEYENKGITTINPAPSQLIEKFKYEVDRFLLESFNRANITLSVEILSLKSNEAKRKRIQKFLELINKYLPKVNYMEELVGIKQSLDVQLQGIPLQIGKTADRPKKLLPISTALVSREPHPAKLLIIENSYANRSQTSVTINFSINLDDITGIRIIGPEEPSVIYKDLLVSEPKNPDLVAPPPYFPRYSELSASQRWVYLNWLNDIQSEINIGYVFLYYYGLERHLLVGNFETAFSEILLLRKCHDNNSFENYSYNALLFSCACHNQPDIAQSILDNESRNGIGNVDLIFKYRFGKNINADDLMSLARKIKGVNLRYIKTQPVRYKTALENVLCQKFGIREYPICSLHNVTDAPQEQVVAFANISLPHDLRTPRLPNFLRHVPFVLDCAEILKHTHDLVKEELKEARTQ